MMICVSDKFKHRSLFIMWQILCYIGETSPECLLQMGQPLNIPAVLPESLSAPTESDVTYMVKIQKDAEQTFYNKHKADQRQVFLLIEN